MEAQAVIDDIVNRLKQIPTVAAVVLGGSRAAGNPSPNSDIDLGIYYHPEEGLDLDALQKAATEIDDFRREALLTGINGWGIWVNGGGWLTVNKYPVDFLYRDLTKVARTIDDCLTGRLTVDYYPGHPHGFINAIYMAEIALCQVLWDPHNKIADLKAKTTPYSPTFKKAVINQFFWEASFSLEAAKKVAARQDASYAAGCCFRTVSCLNQTLFAINERYCMNEKGAVAAADSFSITPIRYKDRTNEIFRLLSADPEQAGQAVNLLSGIIQEIEELMKKHTDTDQL